MRGGSVSAINTRSFLPFELPSFETLGCSAHMAVPRCRAVYSKCPRPGFAKAAARRFEFRLRYTDLSRLERTVLCTSTGRVSLLSRGGGESQGFVPIRNLCIRLSAIRTYTRGNLNAAFRWGKIFPRARGLVSGAGRCLFRESPGKNLFHFFRKHEIEIADSFHAVRDEIDDDFIPNVEPLGVVIHRFGDERNAGHVAEGGDEILALVFAVKLSVSYRPAGKPGQQFCDFVVGKFSCLHGGSPGQRVSALCYARQSAPPRAAAPGKRCERGSNPLS